jgi:hypothetical protein
LRPGYKIAAQRARFQCLAGLKPVVAGNVVAKRDRPALVMATMFCEQRREAAILSIRTA